MKKKQKPKGIYEAFFKRLLDLVCGISALIVFWWLYLIVALAVRVKLGSPVLFKQERPGLNGKIFKLYKFRSMSDERDEKGELRPDSERLTKFGKMLRATSLDELPEAFNIIKGEMSVVGPRPLAVEYLPYYTEEEMRRHSVRPGLSGWAQVNGRTATSWEQRFKYDIEYVDNITFLFDLKIIAETIKKVVKRSDIVEAGSQGDFDKYRIKQRSEY
jgi:undecaprenyl phosphate N,N'-diacetylbacillosamine 1-phosphate transferase